VQEGCQSACSCVPRFSTCWNIIFHSLTSQFSFVVCNRMFLSVMLAIGGLLHQQAHTSHLNDMPHPVSRSLGIA